MRYTVGCLPYFKIFIRLFGGALRILAVLAPLVAMLVMPPECAVAAMSGRCADCHTMHYSQAGTTLREWGGEGPYHGLLTTDCIGCHTGTNTGEGTPYVFSANPPVYGSTGTESLSNTLAGGSFFWVAQAGGDRFGHNAAGIAPRADETLRVPPGFGNGVEARDHSLVAGGSWPSGRQVTCAGTFGCHGTHASASQTGAIRGGHHRAARGAITQPGVEPDEGYRMLLGIAGYEDPAWEFRPTPQKHNQYRGSDGGNDPSAISALCLRCHSQIHGSSGASGWLRHPVDYDMGHEPAGSEHRGYGGLNNVYQVATPVASVNVGLVLSRVTFAGDTIISCLSCHRSHGSPYPSLLRWDYFGSEGLGCVSCHTTKD